MRRIIALLFVFVLFGFQAREFDLYLPLVTNRAEWPASAGVWVSVNLLPVYADELAGLPIDWVRIQWVHAGETMYQAWKRGGWQELDARFSPLLESVQDLGLKMYLNIMPGWECGEIPDDGELARYGSFVTQAADRYRPERISPWNEWDYRAGEPVYYGCFGRANWLDYIYLLSNVNPARSLVVAEYGFSQPGTENYLRLVEPYADEIAIHHYGVYLTDVQYIWPGTAERALELANEHTDLPVLLTETSVREPSGTLCWTPHFQSRQAEVNLDNLALETPLIVYFNYGGRWQCTNIRGSEFESSWRLLK